MLTICIFGSIVSTVIKDYQQQIIENNFNNICQGFDANLNVHFMTDI